MHGSWKARMPCFMRDPKGPRMRQRAFCDRRPAVRVVFAERRNQ